MKADEWDEIERLFPELSDLPPDQQRRRLTQRCRDRPALRRKVLALFDGDTKPSSFVEKPVLRVDKGPGHENGEDDRGPMTGRAFGRYRIVKRIASGGMGSIYLAERADEEFAQQVAIKIGRCGVDSPRLLERFLFERQTLAQMSHPNIEGISISGAGRMGRGGLQGAGGVIRVPTGARRACKVLRQPRATQRYLPDVRDDEGPLTQRIIDR